MTKKNKAHEAVADLLAEEQAAAARCYQKNITPELIAQFSFSCPDCSVDCKWDPDTVGETAGGLTLKGWWRCPKCGNCYLGPRQLVQEWCDEFKLNQGGMSIDAGGIRIRLEAGGKKRHAAQEILRRILRVPDLEKLEALMPKLLDLAQDGLWSTRNAAENSYCIRCGNSPGVDRYADQKDHAKGCTGEALLKLAREVWLGAGEPPDESTGNVCEHGDHPAPDGKRYCSPACQKCDGTDAPEGEDCAGLCGRRD